MNKLTERLQLIYNEVEPGDRVADIGTDHGYLPLALLDSGRASHVIMTDISEGSLDKCRENCRNYALSRGIAADEKNFIEHFDLRLGSGLEVLESGEADTVIMAGMGGILISELMNVNYAHAHSFGRYILQPRKHVGRLRYWLLENDFTVVRESLVREGHLIWPVLTVESFGRALHANSDPEDIEYEYPLTLLDFRNDLTEEYLRNALAIEKEKLAAKQSSSSVPFRELRTQEHRISRLEYLLKKL